MFKYVQLVLDMGNTDLKYGWCLKIECLEELLLYREQVESEKIRKAFQEFHPNMDSAHYTNPWAVFADIRASLKEESFMNALGSLMGQVFENQLKSIRTSGGIYIQACGSYMPFLNDLKEVSAIIVQNKPIPPNYTNDDIHILKYHGGNHYYPKIGSIDVVIDGEVKWNTHERALEMGKKFLEENLTN